MCCFMTNSKNCYFSVRYPLPLMLWDSFKSRYRPWLSQPNCVMIHLSCLSKPSAPVITTTAHWLNAVLTLNSGCRKVAARDTGCCSLENDKDSSRGTLSLFAFASSIRNFSIRSSDKPVFHASEGSVSVIYPFIFWWISANCAPILIEMTPTISLVSYLMLRTG